MTVVEVHRRHGDAHAESRRDSASLDSGGLRRASKSRLEMEIEAGSDGSSSRASKSRQRGISLTADGGTHWYNNSASTAAGAADGSSMDLGSGGSGGPVPTADKALRGKGRKGKSKKHLSAQLSKVVSSVLADSKATDLVCHMEEHANYMGEVVVKWGHLNTVNSAGECCTSCMMDPKCNVWVWCASRGGCGAGRSYQECWLKHASMKALRDSVGTAAPDTPWTSGTMVDPSELRQSDSGESRRLLQLKANKNTPLIYMDVTIKGRPAGRIVVALLYSTSPLAAENFRQLCTGEKGVVPSGHMGAGTMYTFKGSTFYRIVDRFIDQSGANTDSVYGGMFRDDPGGLLLKHDRAGLLSMANAGPDTNTAHFSILMVPAPHLDGRHTIFGEVVEGMGVVQAVNALAKGKKNNTAGPEEQAVIADCGEIRKPSKEALLLLSTALKLGPGPLKNSTQAGAAASSSADAMDGAASSASSSSLSTAASRQLRR